MILIFLLTYILAPASNPADWRFPALKYRILEKKEVLRGTNDMFLNFKPISKNPLNSSEYENRLLVSSYLNFSVRSQGKEHYISYTELGFNGKLSPGKRWKIESEFVFFSKRSKDFNLPYWDPLNDYRRKLYILKGEPAIGMASFFDLRMVKAYTEYQGEKLKFRAGRFNIRMGPGYSSNFLFSGVNKPLNFLFFVESGIGDRLHFVTFNASLPDTVEGKRVAYQRVEINPHKRISLAFSEAVVYTRADLFKYIAPFDFFYLIQRHSADNDDNLLAEGNVTVYLPSGSKIYFIFFDDDWIITPEDRQASLYGYTLGFYTVKSRFDLRLEYSVVSPWSYAHFSGKNAWAINGTPLGHWAGNDFRHFFVEAGFYRSKKTLLTVNLEYLEHGSGNLETPWESSGLPGDTKWPIPPVDKVLMIYGMIEHEGRFDFYLKTGLNIEDNEITPILSLNIRYKLFSDFPVW